MEKILCLSMDGPTGCASRPVEQWLLGVHRGGDEIAIAPWCGDGQMEDAGSGEDGLRQDVKARAVLKR